MENKYISGFWDNANILVQSLDNQFLWMHIVLGILMLTVIIPMVYFLIKYNAKTHPKEKMPKQALTHHTGLEIAWTAIPTAILMGIFYLGYSTLENIRTMPEQGKHIKVIGKKWSWTFEYPNGKVTDKLYVPKDENIILDMTAPINDVIHSFWVPSFRIKEDVVPGRITKLWFNSAKIGSYDIECAEYCGDRHSFMLSKVVVINQNEYKNWMSSNAAYPGGPDLSTEPKGKTLLTNNGCLSCHSIDGPVLVGPTFKGIVGRQVATNNGVLKSNRQYLKDSILNPDKDIVDGYSQGVMPSSQGILNDQDIDTIFDYLKTIK